MCRPLLFPGPARGSGASEGSDGEKVPPKLTPVPITEEDSRWLRGSCYAHLCLVPLCLASQQLPQRYNLGTTCPPAFWLNSISLQIHRRFGGWSELLPHWDFLAWYQAGWQLSACPRRLVRGLAGTLSQSLPLPVFQKEKPSSLLSAVNPELALTSSQDSLKVPVLLFCGQSESRARQRL